MTPVDVGCTVAVMPRAEDELRVLEAARVPAGTRVWVTHFFSHFGSSFTERTRFQEALAAAGFGTEGKFTPIDADEEVAGDGHWHHWSFTLLEASRAALVAADGAALRISGEHGVRYDGFRLTGYVRPRRAKRT